jgi:single-strand DNA-binding protein
VADINRVVLTGRLTADPDLRYTPQGVPVATFTLAVNRPPRRDGERPPADFVDVAAFRDQAEWCVRALKKGSPVAVEGRLRIHKYEDSQGIRRKGARVDAVLVLLLERDGSRPAREEVEPLPVTDDDLPF